MTQQILDNGGTFLTQRTEINSNFSELYGVVNVGSDRLQGIKFYNDGAGAYIDRSAIITIARDTVDPTGIVPSYWSLHDGNGDNATFRGVSGGYLKSRDRSTITAGQRGVLYGLQLSVEPKFTRNNFPFDDAVCLSCRMRAWARRRRCFTSVRPRALWHSLVGLAATR